MNIKYFVIGFAFIIAGCGNNDNKKEGSTVVETNERESGDRDYKDENPSVVNQAKTGGNWEKLVMTPFHDSKGTVTAVMPLPGSWKIPENRQQGQPLITGPHGIKVTDYPGKNFMYFDDPRMQQVYYQSGQPLRAMPGIEKLIEQDLVPVCAREGLQFVRYYEIPEISKTDKWYNDQLYKAVPAQMEIAAFGTEWLTSDNSPYFLLMHLVVGNGGGQQTWYYWCTGLEAEKAYFETAKKQLVFGLVNTHYPLEPIMEYNRSEAEKAGRSWAAHNQRMAQNQANFEASQRAFVNKSNGINDAIMNGWRERNAASDKSHEQFIDVIREQTNVSNPETGQRYKVASGANQYWMNSNGEYISSDKHDYNPNLDEFMNNEKWQELKEVK